MNAVTRFTLLRRRKAAPSPHGLRLPLVRTDAEAERFAAWQDHVRLVDKGFVVPFAGTMRREALHLRAERRAAHN